MNTRQFFEAMNEVSDKYYEEAANYASKRKSHSWLKGGYMAACLVVMLAAAIYVLPNFLGQHGITSPNNPNGTVVDNPTNPGSAVVDKTADVINVNEVAELPQMLLPNLSEDTLIRKSSEEMFEYYGIDLADRLTAIGTFTEQGELHPHGFYFDGTFDLNWFAYASEDGTQEVLICIGKNTRAGEYLNSWYQSGASKSKIGGTEMYLCRYKDTSETCYYAVFELNGCELYVESFTADESGFVSMLKAIAAD